MHRRKGIAKAGVVTILVLAVMVAGLMNIASGKSPYEFYSGDKSQVLTYLIGKSVYSKGTKGDQLRIKFQNTGENDVKKAKVKIAIWDGYRNKLIFKGKEQVIRTIGKQGTVTDTLKPTQTSNFSTWSFQKLAASKNRYYVEVFVKFGDEEWPKKGKKYRLDTTKAGTGKLSASIPDPPRDMIRHDDTGVIDPNGPLYGDIIELWTGQGSFNWFIELADDVPMTPERHTAYIIVLDADDDIANNDNTPGAGIFNGDLIYELVFDPDLGRFELRRFIYDAPFLTWSRASTEGTFSIDGNLVTISIPALEINLLSTQEVLPFKAIAEAETAETLFYDVVPDEDWAELYLIRAEREILFGDDFSDPASGWDVYSDVEVEKDYEDGEYSIFVKVQDLTTWSLNEKAGTFKDFVLEVDARQVSGPDNNDYGLLFRYQDEDNFYSFGVSGDGYYSLYKMVRGEWVAIVDWTESAYINKGRSTNALKVLAKGPEISLYVNDYFLTEVQDGSINEGYIGIYAASFDDPYVHVHFDDLSVDTTD